jgi:hypothetical protein
MESWNHSSTAHHRFFVFSKQDGFGEGGEATNDVPMQQHMCIDVSVVQIEKPAARTIYQVSSYLLESDHMI